MKQYQIILHTDGNKYTNKGSTNYSYQVFAEDSTEARTNAINKWIQTYGYLSPKDEEEMFSNAKYRIIG